MSSLRFSWNQPGGARLTQHLLQASRFGGGCVAAETRQPVVASPFVGTFRIGAVAKFLDQSLLEHATDCAVQRAGAQSDLAVGTCDDVLHDRVAMSIAIG